MDYNFSFMLSFDLVVDSIERKLTKKVVHFKPDSHNLKVVFYYRGIEVETFECLSTFFPDRFEVKKDYDPIIHEFFSTVAGEGLIFVPKDANLKKAFKAVGP